MTSLVICVDLLFVTGVNAGSAIAEAQMSARINVALTTKATNGFEFGSITSGAGHTGGTVSVAPSGKRDCDTSLVCGGETMAASLTISGAPQTSVTYSYPTETVLRSGAETLLIRNIIDSNGGICSLDEFGRCGAAFGATMHVSGGQKPGAYSGSFRVQIDYN